MITLLFPEDDFTASEIAIKLEALSEGKVYVVPKYPWRKDHLVAKKLSQTSLALLLVYDSKKLDTKTRSEIKYLIDKGKPVYAIIPENNRYYGLGYVKKITYRTGDKNSLFQAVQRFINSFNITKQKVSQKDISILKTLGIIAGGLLLLKWLSDD